MEKRMDFTKEDLFNMVAPIHIYQKADVMYEKEAREAFRTLKKLKDHQLVIAYFGENKDIWKERSVRNVDDKIFWKVYNQLFQKMVVKEFPEFQVKHDVHGAKCFGFNGQTYLDGDAYDCFPFYIDSVALKERLNNLKKEVA